jgi:hypothetical protein
MMDGIIHIDNSPHNKKEKEEETENEEMKEKELFQTDLNQNQRFP